MSQNYNFKSLQFEDGENDKKVNPDEIKVFETGETKTIDFIQQDGTRQNFPYAHYMTAWLGQEDNERYIKIFFATHLLTIKGYCLDDIYNHLIKYKLMTVTANDERYLKGYGEDKPFVTDILIEWKGKNDELDPR